MRDTVLAMREAGHWGARSAWDLLRGLVEAWLDPTLVPEDVPMNDTRQLIPRTAWGLLAFVLAGGGFAKVIDDPAVTQATRAHAAIQWSLYAVMLAAGATALVMGAATIPYLVAILRQGGTAARRALAPLVVVPVCAAIYAATLAVTLWVSDGTPLHRPSHVLAFAALGGMTLLCGVCCTVAVLRVATRAPETRGVCLGRRISMAAVGAFTTLGVLAVVSWVVAVAVESPSLLHDDDGVLSTPTLPSLTLALLGLGVAAVLCGRSGLVALSSREDAPRSSR
jgi:hypothetical protein